MLQRLASFIVILIICFASACSGKNKQAPGDVSQDQTQNNPSGVGQDSLLGPNAIQPPPTGEPGDDPEAVAPTDDDGAIRIIIN